MENKVIELLLHYGLTRQEARIYFLLVREGPLSGYEAAKRTGISRSNVYASLAALVEKGAAYIIEEQAVLYQALPVEEFCRNQLHFLEKVASELKEIMPKQQKRNENYITIRGRRNVEDKIRNMLEETEERIYLSVASSILEEFRTPLQKLLQESKKVVLITDEAFQMEGAIIYYAKREDLQIRMITDSSYALTGEMSDQWQTTCLYSENPNLVKLLKDVLANEIRLIQI